MNNPWLAPPYDWYQSRMTFKVLVSVVDLVVKSIGRKRCENKPCRSLKFETGDSMRWESLSSKQLDGISRNTVVVLPTAAIEQHGPHLHVGTDSFIAEKISERLDAACKGHLLTLPVQRIGCSEHHMSFAGSLSFAHEVFAAAVMETIGSVVRHGYRRFLVLNAHGGNQSIGGV